MRLAYARQVEDWKHTAQILAMLHNVNRGKDAEPASPRDYHPMLPPEPVRKLSLFEAYGVAPPTPPAGPS